MQNLSGRFLKGCFFMIETVWNFLIKNIDGRIKIIIDMSLQEITDNDRYLIELNGPERFFTFTYGEYGT